MSEPNERDRALAGLLGVYQDVDMRTIAAYREECARAERERIGVALEHWSDVYGGLALKQLREIVGGGPLVGSCVERCRKAERERVLDAVRTMVGRGIVALDNNNDTDGECLQVVLDVVAKLRGEP